MGDLSKNLSRHEFACRCGCGFDVVDSELVTVLQTTAQYFLNRVTIPDVIGISITINSGCRCYQHNKDEGGSKSSRHMQGDAADFKIKYRMKDGTKKQINPDKVAAYLEAKYPDKFGIGWYKGRTHIDTYSFGKRRWDMR